MYKLFRHFERCQYVYVNRGNWCRGKTGMYLTCNKIELHKDGIQASLHSLLLYLGVGMVRRNPILGALMEKRRRHAWESRW